MSSRIALIVYVLMVMLTVHARSEAQEHETFFKGKTIRFIVAYEPGGGFDVYTRTIARHFGKHIPGNPTTIVENMTGAVGMIAENYVYNQAKPDGLTIGHFVGTLVLQHVLGNEAAKFDGRKFGWLGVPIADPCPKQFYSARVREQPEFEALMSKAEQLLAQDKGNELLWAPASGAMGLFSAKTYENKYGRHEKNDVRPHASRLGCPHLAFAGSIEHPFFPEYAEELANVGGATGSYTIIAGANHFYHGREKEVIAIISTWLAKNTGPKT